MTAVILPASLDHDGVQVRRAQVEDVREDGLIECRLAPYEVEGELAEGLSEVFTRGAFSAAVGNPSRCKVTDQGHQRQVVIGHAAELRDEADGLYGRLKIADTAAGRDVLTLLRSGSLSELSVEFRPQKKFWKRLPRADGGHLWRHDRATLVGVSPVGAGVYGEEARVLAVREAARASAREQALARLGRLTSGPPRG